MADDLATLINTVFLEISTCSAEEGMRHLTTLQNFIGRYVLTVEYMPVQSDVNRLKFHLTKALDIMIRDALKQSTADDRLQIISAIENALVFHEGEVCRGEVSAMCLKHLEMLKNTQANIDRIYEYYAIANTSGHKNATEAAAKFLQFRAAVLRDFTEIMFDLNIVRLTTGSFRIKRETMAATDDSRRVVKNV